MELIEILSLSEQTHLNTLLYSIDTAQWRRSWEWNPNLICQKFGARSQKICAKTFRHFLQY